MALLGCVLASGLAAQGPILARIQVALAGLAFAVNLFLMYTTGEPVEYAIPGQPAPAAAGH